MKYTVKIDDNAFQVEIKEKDNGMELKVDGEVIPFDFVKVGESNLVSILIDNHSFEAEVSKNADSYEVFLKGERFKCYLEDERTAHLKDLVGSKIETGREKELKSPMPGLVVAVEVKAGDQVKSGQGLVIVEAMKMENELKARYDGKVKEVKIKPGQTVEKDEVLIIFE
jgi:biotin carboxyl carrier protein